MTDEELEDLIKERRDHRLRTPSKKQKKAQSKKAKEIKSEFENLTDEQKQELLKKIQG